MTEHDWLSSHSPQQMLTALWLRRGGRPVNTDAGELCPVRRLVRLFACACCRLAWDVFDDPRAVRAVETAEAFADGSATLYALNEARSAVTTALAGPRRAPPKPLCLRLGWLAAVRHAMGLDGAARAAATLVNHRASRRLGILFHAEGFHRDAKKGRDEEYPPFRALLADLLGDPFRAAAPVSEAVLAWHGGAVRTLARAIYQDRSFADAPVLADALEEAGCADDVLLSHLRGSGPHARGCWAFDLVLGVSRPGPLAPR